MSELAWWLLSGTLLVVAVVFMLYPMTAGGFRHDDFLWMRDAKRWFAGGEWWHSQTGLTLTWDALFLTTYRFARLSPAPYYGLLIAGHIAATISVLAALRFIIGSRVVALVGALWFGLLWQHHEVVTWIAVGYRPVVVFFTMMCLIAYTKYRRGGRRGYLFASAFCALLALCSKEDALPLIFLLPLFDIWVLRPRTQENLSTQNASVQPLRTACDWMNVYAPFAAAYVAYIALRVIFGAPGGGAVTVKPDMYWPGLHMLANPLICVPQLLLPDPAFVTYKNMLLQRGIGENALEWMRRFVLVLHIGLSALAALVVFRKIRTPPTVRFSVTWCYLAFLVFVPFVYELACAPRYLYLSSFGMCVLLALLFEWLWKKAGHNTLRRAGLAVLLGFVLLLNIALMRKAISNRLRDWDIRRAIIVSTQKAVPNPVSGSAIYLLNVPSHVEDVNWGIELYYDTSVRCVINPPTPKGGWPRDAYVLRFPNPDNPSDAPILVHRPTAAPR